MSDQLTADSPFKSLYSDVRGLENMLVRVTLPDPDEPTQVEYVAQSSLGPRPMHGMRTRTSTATTTAVDYTEASSLTVNIWAHFNSEALAGNLEYGLFSWNGFSLYAATDGIGSAYTLRATNTQAGFVETSANLNPNQDYLITFVYRYTGAANALEIYVNGDLLAQRAEITAEPSFSAPFVLGGGGNFGPADMTIFALDARTSALTSAEILAYYTEQTMPRIGMGVAGQPLTFDSALITLQLHSYNPLPILADYSGNGNNLTISGTDYSFEPGSLLTDLPQPGDNHIVQRYETTTGGGTQPVPRAAVYDPTFDYTNNGEVFGAGGQLRAGSGIVDNTQTTIQRGGSTYSVPDVAYSRGMDGTWVRFLPNVVVPSSSMGYDDSTPFTGFPVA